ncbi:MAG TPA: SdrD B-like domain-containing protein, partial [Verrucomicrobiae bacterium]
MSLVAALPGAEIINRADLEFIVPGGPTNRLTSDPVRTVSQSAPASQINFFDPAFGLVVTNCTLGQPLFVQADAVACNLDPTALETNTITLTSQLTGDQEAFTAVETAANSGLFRILSGLPTRNVASFPAAPGNGIIETTPGDTLTAQLTGCGSAAAVATILAPPANSGSGLFLQIAATRQLAEIGDFIDFSVAIKNVSGSALTGVMVTDTLPAGFAFQTGTARLEGAPMANPAGGGGPHLVFTVGPMAQDTTVTLTYRVRVGPGAMQGDGVTRAQAASGGAATFVSNLASVLVRLQPGVFSDRAIVFGKVFADTNSNRVQDAGEPGIPGIRLYLEDGTYAITDNEGKYSLYGLSPRTHVIKLDNTTLPRGAQLEVLNNRNAGTPGTRFVDLKRGELHKADFAITSPSAEVLAEIHERRKRAGAGTELDAFIQSRLTTDGVPLSRGDPKSLPASGVVSGPPTGGPSAAGPVKPPAPSMSVPRDDWTQTRTIVLPPGASAPDTNLPPRFPLEAPATNAPNFTPLLPPGTLNSANSDLPRSPVALSPQIKLEHVLTNLDNTPGFVDLKDGDTLPMAQATVRVKGQLGAKLKLAVNGVEVPASRVGQRATLADKQLESWEYIGVTFRPGKNALEMGQFDGFGNVRGSKIITVIAPDKLGHIKIILPKNELSADGTTPAKIEVRLEDSHGVPVTARTPLTLEASLGKWEVPDLDKHEPGTQVFIEGGRAEFTLLAPIEPGDSRIIVSSGAIKGDATLSFLPDLRPMLAVGVIEGQLNLSKLSPSSIMPARSRDGFEEELRDFAAHGNNGRFNAAGRAAFFLKGKIKGEYLLTAGFDSEKETR